MMAGDSLSAPSPPPPGWEGPPEGRAVRPRRRRSPARGSTRMLSDGGAGAGMVLTGGGAGIAAGRNRRHGVLGMGGGPAVLFVRGGVAPPAPLLAALFSSARMLSGAGAGMDSPSATTVLSGGGAGYGLGAGIPATRNLPPTAAVLFRRHGVPAGGAPTGPAVLPSRFEILRMMSGAGAAAAGKENLVVLEGSAGSAGSGAGAGIGGTSSGCGCNCAQQVAQLREDMMAQNQRIWVFATSLMEQNGSLKEQLTDLRIELVKSQMEASAAVGKLSSNIIFSGLSVMFALITFMMPYVKDKWQADTVDVVFAALEKLEKKKKEQALEACDQPKSKEIVKKKNGDSADIPK